MILITTAVVVRCNRSSYFGNDSLKCIVANRRYCAQHDHKQACNYMPYAVCLWLSKYREFQYIYLLREKGRMRTRNRRMQRNVCQVGHNSRPRPSCLPGSDKSNWLTQSIFHKLGRKHLFPKIILPGQSKINYELGSQDLIPMPVCDSREHGLSGTKQTIFTCSKTVTFSSSCTAPTLSPSSLFKLTFSY